MLQNENCGRMQQGKALDSNVFATITIIRGETRRQSRFVSSQDLDDRFDKVACWCQIYAATSTDALERAVPLRRIIALCPLLKTGEVRAGWQFEKRPSTLYIPRTATSVMTSE